MQLNRVHIKNFRSIADVWIEFSPSCRVLVGINESGKSNILHALWLLDEEVEIDALDIRELTPQEDPDQPAYVRFVFTLEKEERIAAYETFTENILGDDTERPIISINRRKHTLAQFFDLQREVIYEVDLRTKKRRFTGQVVQGSQKILRPWKRPNPKTAQGMSVEVDGQSRPLSNFRLIDEEEIDDSLHTRLYELSTQDLTDVVLDAIGEELRGELPACVFWEYTEENLLPGQITIADFVNDPDSCLPLKNMFELAGYSDIPKAIAEAQSKTNGMRNLLRRVSDKATSHMQRVWKEYKGITLLLSENGPNIDANVEDAYNVYDLSRRSDGFKRFITFLLLVSAQVKSRQLENTLYLHDEPDISLHPSGARYLRDELIKISSNNYVVYSTHSIFMIDRDRVDRHLIVQKRKEVTDVVEANGSNFVDEEVLYNALGHSIFENLKKKNILFEGWRDKELFKVALSKVPSKYQGLARVFSNVGHAHAKGVKMILYVTPLLELGNRECVIVSDGDTIAIEHQKDYDGHGSWFRYDELLPGGQVLTGEDFIEPTTFVPIIRRLRSENPSLGDLQVQALQIPKGRLSIIQKWLEAGGFNREAVKSHLNRLKSEVFENLKPTHIEDRYFDFLIELAKKL